MREEMLKLQEELLAVKEERMAGRGLWFTPMSITPLIGMEDARVVLNASRPSPKAILNDEIRYCLQLCCEQ